MTTVQLYFKIRRSRQCPAILPCVAWFVAMKGEARARQFLKYLF